MRRITLENLSKNRCIPYIGALGLGLLSSLAFAPFHLVPLLCVSFSGLLLLITLKASNHKWRAFRLGYIFGLGHFTATLYWIAYSLLVDFQTFYWLVPFSVLGIPLVLSFFCALSCFFFHKDIPPIHRIFLFSALWIMGEWLRSQVLDFPWNLLGYVWANNTSVSQICSVIGIEGLSLLTIFLASSAYPMFLSPRQAGTKKSTPFLTALILFSALWIWGEYRKATTQVTKEGDIHVRIVQPNIPQKEKWFSSYASKNLEMLLQLSKAKLSDNIDFIIWPEAAIPAYPDFINYDEDRRQLIGSILPERTLLISGASLLERENHRLDIYNSIIVMERSGNIIEKYHKTRLVPFGEYLPFRSWLAKLPFGATLKNITNGTRDYSPGKSKPPLTLKDRPAFLPLVCYEAIFQIPSTSVQPQLRWLLNVTNDGWYGESIGPYQHFAMARIRSIETGVPLVRVANTGISGIIDAFGDIITLIPLNKAGIIDHPLPGVSQEGTIFNRYGTFLFWSLFFLFLGIGLKTRFFKNLTSSRELVYPLG